MNLGREDIEYRKKIATYSTSTILLITHSTNTEEAIEAIHEMVMKAKSEQEVINKLNFLNHLKENNMKTELISKNTHNKILEAMGNIEDMSIVRKIVENSKTEEEIIQKLERLHCYGDEYIWYVCYGSNLAINRLCAYFDGKPNKELHINKAHKYDGDDWLSIFENKSFIIHHPIYFANRAGRSSNWGNTGVCFLDDTKSGFSYGRAYKMNKKCFEHLHDKEGKGIDWYNKIVHLGKMDGLEVLTFTNKERLDYVEPCSDYLNVIRIGLEELHIDKEKIERYLNQYT